MQTSYDLVLHPMTPNGALDVGPVQEAIRGRGGVARADGALLWRFPAGDVVTWPLKESEVVRGLELKVPFSERTELLTQVLSAAVELARALGLRLVDPQLQRTVLEADAGAITDEFLRIARYAGQYYGIGDALPMAMTPGEEGLSPVMKALLALAVMGLSAWLAYQALAPPE